MPKKKLPEVKVTVVFLQNLDADDQPMPDNGEAESRQKLVEYATVQGWNIEHADLDKLGRYEITEAVDAEDVKEDGEEANDNED